MTARSIILGLLGAVAIAGLTFVNDNVLRLTPLVGNHFPISVFGLLILVLLSVNPLLFQLRPSWRLRGGELAISLCLMLAACSVPGSGLMRTFMPTLAMPAHFNVNLPGWRKHNIIAYAPQVMLPAGGQHDAQVYEGFAYPRAVAKDISLADVPWQGWRGPLTFWLPLAALLALSAVCLSLIVHRQWSQRERLRYPIAEVAATLMETEPNRAFAPIFRNRLFWIALGIVLGIRVINGVHGYFSGFIEIPLKLEFGSIAGSFPTLSKVPGFSYVTTARVHPAVIGFGFLLAGEVSLSLGLSQIVYSLIFAVLLTAGVEMGGDQIGGSPHSWQLFGSYIGFTLLLLYVGRRYYWSVMRSSLGLGGGEVDPWTRWAARVLAMSVAAAVGVLVWVGLDWPLAVFAVAGILMMYVVVARINAESGLFFVQQDWTILGVLLGLLGPYALGPSMIVILGLVSAVLMLDPRETLMPYVINALKIGERTGVGPRPIAAGAAGAWIVALAVAVPVTFWASYQHGVQRRDMWAHEMLPKKTFDTAERETSKLKLSDTLTASESLAPLERVAAIKPSMKFLAMAGAGVVLVVVFSVLRLRFSGWPLHPIMFLVWGTWPMQHLAPSFLLGWLAKSVIWRIGSANLYRKGVAFMIGAVAGDLLGGLIFMVIGALYYWVTGQVPPSLPVFPT